MTQLPNAFYRDLGDGHYESTTATAGPWGPESQHGGPPSALIGRAMERFAPRPGLRVARVTVEIPRPIPVAELQVEVRCVGPGTRAELLEGEITAGGKTVLLARAWRLAASPEDTPVLRPVPAPPPLPGPHPPPQMANAYMDGYIAAMDWRFAHDEGFDARETGAAWARQRIPLVAGEDETPLTRALTLADSTWALPFMLDARRHMVINTDVTVAIHRDPAGEWLCIRSMTAASPGGSGLAHGQLDDVTGDCGRILQTILIAER